MTIFPNLKFPSLKEPMTFAQAFCLFVVGICFVGIMWSLWFLVTHGSVLKDPTSVAVIMFLIGCLKSGWDATVKYITSSSASSQAKDDVQAKTHDKLVDAATRIDAVVPPKSDASTTPKAPK